LIEALRGERHLYLVMPLMEGGDLFARVEKLGGKGLPLDEARGYFRDLLKGLLELKAHGIAHG
jgi:serine/threonine protein kinase